MKPITRNLIAQADAARNRWCATPEAGSTLDDMLAPEATAHIANQLRPGDILEVCPADQTYYAELMVKTADRNTATFWTLQFVELAGKATEADEGEKYAVTWGGPAQKHRVIRKADGVVLKHGFSSADEAHAWAVENAKEMV